MFYDFCSTPGYIHLFFSLHNGQLFYITNLASFNRIVESVPSFHVVAIQGHLPALIANYTKRFDLAPQRSLHVIGAEVPAGTWAHLVPIRFGRAMNAYGASEVLGTSYSTMGAPYSLTDDTEMQIVDADGNPVAPGDTGMIEVRNPRMVDGYLWNADLTQRHFVNGWFRTFDIGRMPTPQTVIVTGRADDMLNIGGIKVMPHMYEEKLRNVAGITDAVVISIPDKNNISRMHVICEGDRQTIDQPFADIVSKTLGQTGFSFHLHCVKTLPRTETGKVQRNALKEKFADM